MRQTGPRITPTIADYFSIIVEPGIIGVRNKRVINNRTIFYCNCNFSPRCKKLLNEQRIKNNLATIIGKIKNFSIPRLSWKPQHKRIFP